MAILARRAEQLASAVQELSSYNIQTDQRIYSIQADVTQKTELETALLAFVEKNGVPDLIFNSAGVAHPGRFEDLRDDILPLDDGC